MATIPVLDRNGKKVGKYDIDPVDLAPRINKQLLHDAVVMYQANLRQGTVKTKNRGEVSGASQKMYRQKGTGHARAGSRRSGVRVGGGHIHAKRNRDYSYRMPRKALQLATRMALASKIRDGQLVLVDELKFEEPKTKEMASILKAVGCDDTVLVAIAAHDGVVHKSTRNIANADVLPVSDLNAFLLLKPQRVLMTKDALDAFAGKGKKTDKE